MDPIDLICFQSTLTQRVDLLPEELGKLNDKTDIYEQIGTILEDKIRDEIEGKCNRQGLVLKGSLKLISRDVGMIVKGHFNGNMVYNVLYKILICNPNVNVILPCKVINKNKIGLLTHFIPFTTIDFNADEDISETNRMIESQFKEYPLLIKVPYELHTSDETHLFQTVNDGDIVYVNVLGKKFELNDRQLTVIGKLSSDVEYNAQITEKN